MPAYYKESQKFTQIWLWAILAVTLVPTVGLMTFGFIKQLIFQVEWGTKPMDNLGLTLTTIFTWGICGGVMWMLYTSELITEVRDKAVFYRFKIFAPRMKRIGVEDIESWEVTRYSPMEYGGYGVRKTLKRKTAFTVKGRHGLELKLKDGRTILIGTQRPDEIRNAVRREFDRFEEV